MEKPEVLHDTAPLLMQIVEDLRKLADSIQKLGTVASEEATPVQPKEEKEKPKISLEQIRGVLAEKSRDGFTAEVREIIKRHGANRLSEVDPVEYEAMITEAENLK